MLLLFTIQKKSVRSSVYFLYLLYPVFLVHFSWSCHFVQHITLIAQSLLPLLPQFYHLTSFFVTILTPTGDDDGEEFWLSLLTVLAAPDCCSPALSTCWFIKQLFFCTHSSTIWPHWSLWCLAGSCGDTQLPWGGHELCFTYPPPPPQTRPLPVCHCFFHLLLIVSMSGRECTTWWRVTLDGQTPAFFCLPRIGLEIGQQKMSPDVCCEVQYKEGPTMVSISAPAEVCSLFMATKG